MIFLCWFGAAGYLLTRYGGFVAGVVLVLAAVCGVAGGAIVFFFLARVLMPHERELTGDETDGLGVVGRCRPAIRAGGTGEMVYEQLGRAPLSRRAPKTATKFPNRKRSSSCATRKELRMCASGKKG